MDTLIVTYIIFHDENFTIVDICIEIIRVGNWDLGDLVTTWVGTDDFGNWFGIGVTTWNLLGVGLVWLLGTYLLV